LDGMDSPDRWNDPISRDGCIREEAR